MAIINNNVQNVKFLRNQTPFVSREAARQALEDNKGVAADGTALLARYTADNDVKTLVGFVAEVNSTKYVTIIDVEGGSADVEELRREINAKLGTTFISSGNTVEANLTALSGTSYDASGVTSVWGAKAYADDLISTLDYEDTAVAGQYVSQVTQADGNIAVTRVELPSLTEVKEIGKPIVAVSEDKGQVAASAGTINAEFVNIADSGNKFTATTVEGALAEIATEIDGMDLAEVSGEGEVITAVSENDGKVSASKTAIKDVKLTGYVKDTTKTGDIAATDDIEDALSKLENKAAAITIDNADGSINVTTGVNGTDIAVNIKSGEHVLAKDGNAGVYTDIKLSAVTPSSTTVKEEYSLVATDGSVLGTNIKIYKDSSVVNITYITDPSDAHYQNLKYTYVDVSGNTQTEYVDISSLVLEAEFASGVTVTNHVAHGVVDQTSENFLTVGADGFKLAGVQDAIDGAVNALDATGGTQTIATDKHVAVEVIETDGKITTVTVVEDNIADADDLANEIAARKAVDGVNGDAYSADTNANYISGASSLYGADQALDTALNTVDNSMLTGVTAGNGITVSNKEGKSQTISAKVKANGGIVNDADGLHLDYIDAGVYDA